MLAVVWHQRNCCINSVSSVQENTKDHFYFLSIAVLPSYLLPYFCQPIYRQIFDQSLQLTKLNLLSVNLHFWPFFLFFFFLRIITINAFVHFCECICLPLATFPSSQLCRLYLITDPMVDPGPLPPLRVYFLITFTLTTHFVSALSFEGRCIS